MILQTGWVKCEGKSGNDFLQLGVFTNRRVYQLDNLVCLHWVRDPLHRNGLVLLTADMLLDKQVGILGKRSPSALAAQKIEPSVKRRITAKRPIIPDAAPIIIATLDIRRLLPILFSRLCFTCPSSRPPDSTDAPVPATLFGNRDARAGTGVVRCRTGSRHHQAWPLWWLAGRTDGSRS